ncbi:uncharacterized protein DDB_G0284459 [Microplitis demolitor]|uniref:uncharacterized protein DDB_G0284459 n=1 Tax=Microplitis demolitor TaxID=69319 RepID=UPI0004CCA207|nr:uncharacterized protein DDB_G0284459 [Microplitis demolitor]XP_008547158.1 uncharacterized protein DDB_G0284459 [Microplitis demolitor]XP_008547160.1 uncharacterized protein DDB_G0284459 [Microplitis demolitor]XP_053596909.1 uncharacterized protein DDB_G0284459 [Microplitis demolitor]
MPRIDPLSLLKCLGVLLGPNGGIKGKAEVDRLAGLMIKFSKKLVSKCIYIQILKSTEPELLSQFMTAGGWNLIHMWLTDGIVAKNWALIQELLELLLLCPVDVDRLKSNNCPKLIKGLSKEGSHQGVRMLAGRLVEQWLKLVKGETAPNSIPTPISVVTNNVSTSNAVSNTVPSNALATSNSTYTSTVANSSATATVVSRQGDKLKTEEALDSVENTTVRVQDLALNNSIAQDSQQQQQQFQQQQIHIQPVQLQLINKTLPGQLQPTQIKSQSFVVVSNSQNQPSGIRYKIILRDGKQVLTKVETDASNIANNINNDSDNNVDNNKIDTKQEITLKDDNISLENGQAYDNNDNGGGVELDSSTGVVKNEADVDNKDESDSSKVKTDENVNNNGESNNKSSDKENRDSQKKDDKSSSSSSDKKSSHHQSSSSRSSSKHSSSSSRSSSRKSSSSSSHRSSSSSKSTSSSSKSSKDKDRHHSSKHSSSSSSSRSKSDKEKDRDKEKEKQKKDQAEKDKATLEKVQGQSLNNKFGKIPKKKPEDEKPGDPLRKSSTDSRDSSKENKDKSDTKKTSPSSPTILEKKNISISIENRKNSQDSSRPKTVKTFNSKFRSTGLEEEVKPPPPRTAGKKPSATATATGTDKKIVPPKLPIKRSSPIRETGASAEKKPKVSLEPPAVSPSEDKKGAIKLIAPKPKPMVLQESDMFMDALTASTKNKEPRKRKRRTSVSKDGSNDTKKSDSNNSVADQGTRDTTPPPTSPTHDDRSPVSMKPEFKFYQDTLETDEDKEDKERTQNDKDDDSPDEKANNKDRVNDEDDERSRTPTCDDDSEETKAPASPDDPEDSGRAPTPNEDIRYVDGLRSVLLLQKRKGPKKSLKWKTDLESVRYFELDETERVNVTKTFTDMKQMEKMNEREAFQMARKLSTEDTMEEKTRWKVLVPIDLPPPLVEPGKDSKEKDIQYAREKGILQALYFNRSMIPDSPSEPDEERHHIYTEPKIIPLDDISENASKDSDKDFTTVPWPEPKPQLPMTTPVVPNVHFPSFQPHNQVMPVMQMPNNSLGPLNIPQQQIPPPMLQAPMNHMAPIQEVSGAGGWRTGDGKVVVPDVTMNNMPNMPGNMNPNYPPPGMDPSMMPPNMPPNLMPPPGMFNQQDGYPNMMPEDGSFGHMPNNFQGPGMFGPGPGPGPGPNFPNGPPPRGVGPMHNRGRGGPPGPPGWFRGGGNPGVGPMRGGWGGRGGWRGNGKQPPVCRQFTKNGYCRVGDKCQYLHPGVNCPPF